MLHGGTEGKNEALTCQKKDLHALLNDGKIKRKSKKVRCQMADWEKKLEDFLEQQKQFEESQNQKAAASTPARTETRKEDQEFIRQTVEPAFLKLADKLKQHEKQVCVTRGDISRILQVWSKEIKEFEYTIWIDGGTVQRKYKATPKSGSGESNGGHIGKGDKQPTITNIAKDDILNDFVDNYTRTMRLGRKP